jgi:hypothetical protein
MGYSGRSSEEQNADRHADSTVCALEASGGNEDHIGNETIGHLCYILAKTLFAFCPYPETLFFFFLQYWGFNSRPHTC